MHRPTRRETGGAMDATNRPRTSKTSTLTSVSCGSAKAIVARSLIGLADATRSANCVTGSSSMPVTVPVVVNLHTGPIVVAAPSLTVTVSTQPAVRIAYRWHFIPK